MTRFSSLFLNHLRVGVINELQYRVNFFIHLFRALLELGTGLVGLALVFQYTQQLAGWSRPELLAVMGVHILLGGVIATFIAPNMERLMADVLEGTLDYALSKPVDAQVLVSVREVRVWSLTNVLVGATVIGVALAQLGVAVGLGQALAFLVALLAGGLMLYSFWLIITTGAFWIVRIDNIINLFEGVYQAGRWPVSIYPGWLRTGLTFLVPVAFAVTVPAQAVANRLTPPTLLGAVALAAALLTLARWFWLVGLRRYSGASA